MKYTPGSWDAKFDEDAMRWTIRAPLGENVPRPRSAVSSGWDEPRKTFELCRLSGNRPNAEADAVLIALAPNMRAFIQHIADMNSSREARELLPFYITRAKAILEKISGEAHDEGKEEAE